MESDNKEKPDDGQASEPKPVAAQAKEGATIQSQTTMTDQKRAAEQMQKVLKQLVI